MIKCPKAVIFDMDGLLFDSETLSRIAMFAAAEELGHTYSDADFLELVGRPWAANRLTLQDQLGPDADVEAFRRAWTRQFDLIKPSLALKAGALDLLQLLDNLSLPRAICTSSSHDEVVSNLALHSLVDRFDAVIAAGDYQRGKPYPDPYLRAADALRVEPADCLALEDSHNGVRSAAAAGMQTIMVPDLLPATDEMTELCAFVASDLDDVRNQIASSGQARTCLL